MQFANATLLDFSLTERAFFRNSVFTCEDRPGFAVIDSSAIEIAGLKTRFGILAS